MERDALNAWLTSFLLSDIEGFERLDLGVPFARTQPLRMQIRRVLEPLRSTISGGLNLRWRIEEFRSSKQVRAEALVTELMTTSRLSDAYADMVSAMLVGNALDANVTAALTKQTRRLAEELAAYQTALFKAVVVAEKLKQSGTDLSRLLPTTEEEPKATETHLTLVAIAAFRFPFWTAEPEQLSRAGDIERACQLGSVVLGMVPVVQAEPLLAPQETAPRVNKPTDLSLTVPENWRFRDEDQMGLSFEAKDGWGNTGEVFLHRLGFEKAVPQLDVFVGQQRNLLGLSTSLKDKLVSRLRGAPLAHQPSVNEDRAISHPSGLPAHLLAWSSMEPSGELWTFRALYLRAHAAVFMWKLDQEGRGSAQLAKEHLETFNALMPK